MKIVKQYKFLRKGNKSQNGNQTWKLNKWVKVKRCLDMCNWGLHSCQEPYDAFSYVQGEILAVVECRGQHLHDNNKDCWQEQRVIKTYKWTKKDSLKLAIYSAELCLKNFEEEYPNDLRPRQAIESAKKVLFKDTEANRSAAESAWSAARSAAWSAAQSAAESAARSAQSAAESAWSAARSAAQSAAESAARSAAQSAAIKKIRQYFMDIVKEKETQL